MIDIDAQIAYGIFWAAYAIAFVVFYYMMKSCFAFYRYTAYALLLAALVAVC